MCMYLFNAGQCMSLNELFIISIDCTENNLRDSLHSLINDFKTLNPILPSVSLKGDDFE